MLHTLVSLVILTLLELILGTDNIIFISLQVTKVPVKKRFRTRVIALSLAFVMRVIMLFCIVWLSRIISPLFTISGFYVSIRDLLFFIGGIYLIFSTIKELAKPRNVSLPEYSTAYHSIILQIVVVDMLFSFDSIFTAIGLIPDLLIMILAIGIGMIFMIFLSGKISAFIEKNPSVKKLALGFIIVVGLMLVAEAFHIEIPRAWLYALFGITFIGERIYSAIKHKR